MAMPIYKTKPMLIQEKSITFGMMHRAGWGLISDMGTGKTLTALYWAQNLGLKCVAVLGRPDDLDTWEEQITQHTGAKYVNICRPSSTRERLKLIKPVPGVVFYLLTYDSVKHMRPALQKMPWDGVIADEMAELRHWSSKKTKAVIKTFATVPHRVGITGTPITNTPLNIFSQMLFIDGGKRFGTSEWDFKNEYFWPNPNGHGWFPFDDTIPRIRKKIYEVCIRFRKEDALDLPPKIFLKKTCGMSTEQAKWYKRIKEEFELELKSGEVIELDYIIQQFTKLMQVTGGFYYNPDHVAEDLPCGKMDQLKWMLDQGEFRQTKKIVIWAAFNHELERIRDMAAGLGYHGVMFWKHTPDRKATREQFAQDPQCQLFIGQVSSGIGMNELKVADTVFYYSRSLKLIHRLQSEDRTHRKGSEIHDRIRYIDLIVPGTVDGKTYSMLRKYRDVASQIVDGRTALAMLSPEVS